MSNASRVAEFSTLPPRRADRVAEDRMVIIHVVPIKAGSSAEGRAMRALFNVLAGLSQTDSGSP